jgi:hypothetical protein
LLETLRRGSGAEPTIGVYHNRSAVYGSTTNAGDKRSRLDSLCADADSIGLASNPCVSDLNIVVARG